MDGPILFIIGSGDELDRVSGRTGRLNVSGSSDLNKLLLDREPYSLLHVGRKPVADLKETQAQLAHYRVLVNLITEAEKNSRTLYNLCQLLRGATRPVINPPEKVLRSTRDQVAELLAGTKGLIVAKVVRLRGGNRSAALQSLAEFGAPIILRQAGTHAGKIIGRFEKAEDAVAALEGDDEHLATQFVDFRSADGLYRKYRVFFIGQRMILRHMLVSDQWNVHAADRARFMAGRPELIAEERALFERDGGRLPEAVMRTLEAVRRKMKLDFFGLDFGLTEDGQVVLFEGNATMSFFPYPADPKFEYLLRSFEPAQLAFRELLGLPLKAYEAPPFLQTA